MTQRTWVLFVGPHLFARSTGEDPPDAGYREAVGDEATRDLDPVQVPEVITNAQGQAALRLAILPDGRSRRTAAETVIRDGVTATRALPESDPRRIRADLALIGWEQTNEWRRTGATVAAIAGQLAWTEAEVDALFIVAARVDL